MARVTAKDVGRLAKVHPSTVSRVLNRAFELHSYDAETIRRVEECAARLGYRPSHAARSLRSGKTMIVGVVVSDIANLFFAHLASHIEQAARRQGYRTLICSTSDDPELQAEHLADLAACHVDGIILSPSGPSGIHRVRESRLPLVLLDRPLAGEDLPYVGLDNHLAGRMLGEHLVARDYRRVGVVMPQNPLDPSLMERFDGLRRGLGRSGEVAWTIAEPLDRIAHEGRQALVQRIGGDDRPDAVIGVTNDSTLAIVHAAGDCDLAIGRDLGVAGIDDFIGASVLKPGITVVAQPVAEIAEAATALLVGLMGGTVPEDQPRCLPPTLLARGSLGERLVSNV